VHDDVDASAARLVPDVLDVAAVRGDERRTLAGEHLLKVLEGKITLGYDPETGQVRLFER